jgi:uncharacterized protein (DUF1501 family)
MASFKFTDRRSFCKTGAATAAGLGVLGKSQILRADEQKAEPHFFLQLFLPGGMDASYTFDARPLSMTAAELIQNYIGKEPTMMTGSNGNTCLRTELVNPLLPFLDRFSVLNGVMMAPDFDGHEDNQSVLLTGNPLGGSSFHGALGRNFRTPVSTIIGGVRLVSDDRVDTPLGVRLNLKTAKDLSQRLGVGAKISEDPRMDQFLKKRFAVGAKEDGSFAKTKFKMGQAVKEIPALSKAISSMEIPEITGETETVLDSVKLAISAFKADVCHAALCVFDSDLSENQNLDAHDFEGAKEQPRIISELLTELSGILKHLETTPFSDTQSMLDVTTVFITSEFGRTMRQYDFKKSGTDHNSLTNTMLIGGKGIKGGQVIGASDFASVEDHKNASKAHLSLDQSKQKIMAGPFNFEGCIPTADKPEAFKLEHYLTSNSVVNTIFSLFGVAKGEWRVLTRNGDPAPIISSLLT